MPGQRNRNPDDLADEAYTLEYTEVHRGPGNNQRQDNIPPNCPKVGAVDFAEICLIKKPAGVLDTFDSLARPGQFAAGKDPDDTVPQKAEAIRQDYGIISDYYES